MTETAKKRSRTGAQGLSLFFALLLMASYLLFSKQASRAVLNGMNLCARTLIPSIFPFLVLNGFLLRCGLAEAVGRRVGKGFRRLFGVSGRCAAPMIAGALCGFPTGAAGIAALYRQGLIDKEDCRRGLLLASSASPAFLIVGVGMGILGSARYGVILYGIQLLSLLLVAFFDAHLQKPKSTLVPQENPSFTAFSFATALRESLRDGVDAIISVCGSVIFFSSLSGMLASIPDLPTPFLCLVASGLELTSGIALTVRHLPLRLSLVVIAAAVGFSGFSVHAQVAAVGEGLPMGDYIKKKTLTSLLSAALAALFLHGKLLFPF